MQPTQPHKLTPQEELILNRWAQAKQKPWKFLCYFVLTKDEHDKTALAASKPFPMKAVYRIVVRAFLELDVAFIEKSRQIMMTWIMAALYLWDAMFHPARLIFLQSKKQEDADAILERAKHIYRHLDNMRIAGQPLPGLPKVKMTGETYGTQDSLRFLTLQSELRSIPQGPDIVRSYTSSGILADEMNHQPKFSEGYAAAMPSINGGGKYIAQGTANGKNSGYRMLYGIDDQTNEPAGENTLDSDIVKERLFEIPPDLSDEDRRYYIEEQLLAIPDDEFERIPLEILVANAPGMRYWKTAQGGDSLRVHYTADPDKDPITKIGREWKRKAQQAQKSKQKWLREMEINYNTHEGRPVIVNWDENRFVRPIDYLSDLFLELGIDFGAQVNVVFLAQVLLNVDGYANTKQLRLLDEIVLRGLAANTPEQARKTVKLLKERYGRSWSNNKIKAYCDPNANIQLANTSDRNMRTNLLCWQNYGVYPSARKFGVPESTEMLETVFTLVLPNGEPAVLIHPRCKYLISCLEGGLHYPEVGREGYYDKDGEFDHGGDALRYIVANVFNEHDLTGVEDIAPPKPKYYRDRVTGRRLGKKRSGPTRWNRGVHHVRT